MNTIGKIIFSIGLAVSSLFGFKQMETPLTAGASFTPVQASQFTLSGAGITSSSNTIQLNSFTLPDQAKTPISMSMFGQVGYAVLEPQTSKIENITFTGVTQNANGTALLTGVSRGVSFYSPYAASTTLALSHAGGSYLILSNSAAFYGKEFLFANNIGTSTAILVYSSTTPPRYDSVAAQASGTFIATTSEFASITYVNKVATAGCATGSASVTGCVRIATQLQSASSTYTALAPTLLSSQFSTSSPYTAGLWTPITMNDGKLSPLFIATSSNYTYNWMAANVFQASTTAVSRFSIAGTAASPFVINTVPYSFPASIGAIASSSVLMADTSGNFTFGSPQWSYLNTSPGNVSTTASTTIFRTTLPGKSLGSTGYVEFNLPITTNVQQAGANVFEVAYGNATSTITLPWTAGNGTKVGMLKIYIAANAATNSQKIVWNMITTLNGNNTTTETGSYESIATIATDSTADQPIMVVGRVTNAAPFTADIVTGKLNR